MTRALMLTVFLGVFSCLAAEGNQPSSNTLGQLYVSCEASGSKRFATTVRVDVYKSSSISDAAFVSLPQVGRLVTGTIVESSTEGTPALSIRFVDNGSPAEIVLPNWACHPTGKLKWVSGLGEETLDVSCVLVSSWC